MTLLTLLPLSEHPLNHLVLAFFLARRLALDLIEEGLLLKVALDDFRWVTHSIMVHQELLPGESVIVARVISTLPHHLTPFQSFLFELFQDPLFSVIHKLSLLILLHVGLVLLFKLVQTVI